MSDIYDETHRSAIMSRIRSADTTPEKIVRKLLRDEGLIGYRLHRKDLPGKPDIVFGKKKLANFVHGCFWHGHKDCRRAKIPETHHDKWALKIAQNRKRDSANISALLNGGWRVAIVWQCALPIKYRDALRLALKQFAESDNRFIEFERKFFEKNA